MPTSRQLLEPYLFSDTERPNGDMDMHCPIHGDARRSATVNFQTREWYCHACEEGGSLTGLISRRGDWHPVPQAQNGSGGRAASTALPDSAKLDGWASALLGSESAREYLMDKRGLSVDTIQRYGIGWNGNRYMFPIYDEKGALVNVRMYSPSQDPKWINWQGFGSPPRLYPATTLLDDPSSLLIAEGEMDTLLANQHGIAAVTSTGGAKSMGRWRAEWNRWMQGRTVSLCFDRDAEGRQSARKAATVIKKAAKKLRVIELPFPMGSKKDLSDFFLEGGTINDLSKLAKVAGTKPSSRVNYREVEYESLRRGKMVGRPVIVEGTVAGVNSTQLTLPIALQGRCNYDWDPKRCAHCPLNEHGGNLKVDVSGDYRLRLELLITNTGKQKEKMLKEAMGVPPNCPKVEVTPDMMSFWDCEIRNGSNMQEEAYPILLKRDDKPPTLNSLYKFSGRLRASPRGQRAVIDADDCTPAKQDLDSFVPDLAGIAAAKNFIESIEGDDPIQKLEGIAELLELHVTRIFGQRKLHIAADLVYHSVLRFPFQEQEPARGWMELAAVGDTRSGKSTTAKKLAALYGRGHYEAVENSTSAGLLYGMEKRASLSGGAWSASIGILPLQDRGLAVLDEAGGLTKEQIGQMSSMRSDGYLHMVKMRHVTCPARVRIIWLANPRKRSYANGIEAIADLMGAVEDLARVDIPLMVKEDIGDELNKARESHGDLSPEVPDILRWIVLWAWSRQPRDIKWTDAALKAAWDLGENLSEQFAVNEVPIFTRNEAPVRLARMAVALAARLFSSPDGTKLSVQTRHVVAAEKLYERFLSDPNLDLVGLKEEEIKIDEAGRDNEDFLKKELDKQSIDVIRILAKGTYRSLGPSDFGGSATSHLASLSAIMPRGDEWDVTPWALNVVKEYMKERRV